MNRAVFLDRDNTIIHNDGDLGDPEQVRLIQGAASAMASLRGLGYKIVVVSNQGGVARGKYTEQDVDAVNARIAEIVQRVSGASIDRFYYCPFHPEGTVRQYKREHPWRKPAPGMLKQAADDLHLDLAQCWTVGDQSRDIAAGRAAGTRTVLLRDRTGTHGGGAGVAKAGDAANAGVEPDFVAASLVEAVRVIAQQRRPEREAGPLPKPTSPAVAKLKHAGASPGANPAASGAAARVEPGPGAAVASAEPLTPASPGVVEPPIRGREPEPEPPGATDYLPDGDDADDAPIEADDAVAPDEAEPSVSPAATSPPPPPILSPTPPAAPVAPPPSLRAASLASPIRPARPQTPAAAPTQMTPGVPSPRPRPMEQPIAEPPPPAPSHTPPVTESIAAPIESPAAASPDRPLVQREDAAQIEELLRQILRQLKRHRADHDDFSYLKMSAAIFQMIAATCVMFGLYYGLTGEPGGVLAFLQWFLGAILCQITVVTLLILHWQK